MSNTENNFEDYAVIPLDLPAPPVDIDRLRAFVHKHCDSCAFTGDDIRMVVFYARKPIVDGKLLLHSADPRFEATDDDSRFDWDPAFATTFPDLAAWFESFPFTRLDGVTFVTQTADVDEHMDIFGMHNSHSYYELFRDVEPRYYRIIFGGDEVARNESFYVTQSYRGEREFVRLPSETAVIAMGSSTCYHGAKHKRGHYKSTVAVYGTLDVARHRELLRRSLAKHADRSIRLRQRGPVGGPAAVMPYGGVAYDP